MHTQTYLHTHTNTYTHKIHTYNICIHLQIHTYILTGVGFELPHVSDSMWSAPTSPEKAQILQQRIAQVQQQREQLHNRPQQPLHNTYAQADTAQQQGQQALPRESDITVCICVFLCIVCLSVLLVRIRMYVCMHLCNKLL